MMNLVCFHKGREAAVNGIMIATVIMTILITWVLLVSYHYAYNRKWGNENASVDALPKETLEHGQAKVDKSNHEDRTS